LLSPPDESPSEELNRGRRIDRREEKTPINLVGMLYQQLQRPFWRRHPWVTAAAALLPLWLLLNVLLNGGALFVVTAVIGLLIVVRRRARAIALRDAGLRARADYEHRLSLAGDPRGLYGRYPPVQPGWFPDPQSRCQLRYFDGAMWTPYTLCR
jgi:hypothetical protein